MDLHYPEVLSDIQKNNMAFCGNFVLDLERVLYKTITDQERNSLP